MFRGTNPNAMILTSFVVKCDNWMQPHTKWKSEDRVQSFIWSKCIPLTSRTRLGCSLLSSRTHFLYILRQFPESLWVFRAAWLPFRLAVNPFRQPTAVNRIPEHIKVLAANACSATSQQVWKLLTREHLHLCMSCYHRHHRPRRCSYCCSLMCQSYPWLHSGYYRQMCPPWRQWSPCKRSMWMAICTACICVIHSHA